jgi:hypothetical protein
MADPLVFHHDDCEQQVNVTKVVEASTPAQKAVNVTLRYLVHQAKYFSN